MRFSKTGNIYKVIRETGSQNNILGISFVEPNSSEANLEVIEWDLPDIKADGIPGSKETVTEQVFSGLDTINKRLGTDYKVSKIYFVPADGASDSVYDLLIRNLINHYHSGNEFKEV